MRSWSSTLICRNTRAFVVFKYQTERARVCAEVNTLKQISAAANTSWQAAGWFLERTRPERYGRRLNVNLAGSPSSPVEVRTVTVDELMAKMDLLRQQEEGL